ncbi:flavin reductase [Streptomyces carminius]|uniref:Flavin reductase n=1 Tax=Streptomyces carminius TaxID=2665496 RepID=A0A2M8LSG2_9ACTN|nr:flavin reductase family protein [Streptomyces carminius]PJE94893.1 flavin reductase [Streptomyces carminius]
MAVSISSFTEAMSRVPAPVTVATTVTPDGRAWGFTASSFCSLSLRPPLILLCLAKEAESHLAFTRAGSFLINVLAAEHAPVALHFARRSHRKVATSGFVPCEKGLPGLPEATARVACSTHSVVAGGDHSIIVGLVESTYVSDRIPLSYCDRAFARPTPLGPDDAGPRKEHDDPHSQGTADLARRDRLRSR